LIFPSLFVGLVEGIISPHTSVLVSEHLWYSDESKQTFLLELHDQNTRHRCHL